MAVSLKSKKIDFRDTIADTMGVSEGNEHRQKSISLHILSKYISKMYIKVEGHLKI